MKISGSQAAAYYVDNTAQRPDRGRPDSAAQKDGLKEVQNRRNAPAEQVLEGELLNHTGRERRKTPADRQQQPETYSRHSYSRPGHHPAGYVNMDALREYEDNAGLDERGRRSDRLLDVYA